MGSATRVDRTNDLAEVLELGVLRVDVDLRVTEWNRWLTRASGLSATDAIGRRVDELFPTLNPGARDAFARAVQGQTVVMSHRFHGCLLPLPPPPGFDLFPSMQQTARLAPALCEDGTVCGALAIITDVTERVAREVELSAATQQAQAANRAKSDFLAAMSHELRTPIGAMWSYADLLLEEMFGPVPPAQRERLERIKSVGDHLLQIVGEILTFARLEAGREEIHVERVDLCQLMREAASAVESIAIRKKLTLSIDVPPDPVIRETDMVKLRQILINLLGNAIKFTAEGSVGMRLRTYDDQSVSIAVHDTGRGILPADLDRIFDPFTQATASHARSETGTGLGLTVSRRLARLLGGDITASSQPGEGSTFEVRFSGAPG